MRRKYLILCLVPMLFCVQAQAQDYQDLIGRWIRPDGGYILLIKDVQEDGRMDVAYYNPNTINVYNANANIESDKINLYVELRDRGYPGSNYKLTYDKKKDRLVGVYHHAVLKQNFDIYFVRGESKTEEKK